MTTWGGKLLDLEFRQRRNNLIFEGVADSPNETDLQCIAKLRQILCGIPGINVEQFRIDQCYWLERPIQNYWKQTTDPALSTSITMCNAYLGIGNYSQGVFT